MVAIVDTAPPLGRGKASPPTKTGALRLRVLSAFVLAPLALAAVWFGSPFLPLMILGAGAVMGWEWARLCGRGRIGSRGVLIIATVVTGILVGTAGDVWFAVATAILGSLLVGVLGRGGKDPLLAALGILWIGLPCIALAWLAQDPVAGRSTVLWILAIVWATDIGAYIVGRTLGGPRLAPRMSPNKTWSGLLGGMLCATGAGVATALITGAPVLSPLPLLSGVLAIVAQSGDLAESVAKRHFGVKDSSGLIPGHGGLLDRLDGLLAVIPAVALLSLAGGSSVVTWR
jgi:phosphatidate cytidylyltransferase